MGNAMVFLFAGYETTASMLQFLAYQLALNPKIQDRLIQEIDDVVGKVYIHLMSLSKNPESIYMSICLRKQVQTYDIRSSYTSREDS